MTPMLTRYTPSRIEDEYSVFMLLFLSGIVNIIVINRNIVRKDLFCVRIEFELKIFIGFLLLSEICRSDNASTECLVRATAAHIIFRVTMFLEQFKMI